MHASLLYACAVALVLTKKLVRRAGRALHRRRDVVVFGRRRLVVVAVAPAIPTGPSLDPHPFGPNGPKLVTFDNI